MPSLPPSLPTVPRTPVHWLVQTDLGPDGGVQRLVDAVRAQGHGLTLIERHPPMATEPPRIDVPDGHLALVYGTANLVEQVAAHRPWWPGVWFDAQAFNYTAWARHYGRHLLNDPADVAQVTLAGLLEQAHTLPVLHHADVFVRPEHDLKAFPGTVRTPGELLVWAQEAVTGRLAGIGPDTPVVIAPAHGIAAEWRVVVTDEGEVIGSSRYRSRGRLSVALDTPDDVLAFARARAQQWSPAPVFVLDVARSGEGLYVVEAQCAHCAGFYAMDLNAWVDGMVRVAQRVGLAPTPTPTEASLDQAPSEVPVVALGKRRRLR